MIITIKKYNAKSPIERKELLLFMVFVVIYRLLLDWSFKKVISVCYGYSGFTYLPSTSLCIMSWAILVLFTYLVFRYYFSIEKISHEILFLFFLIAVVPFTSMMGGGQFNTEFVVYNIIYWAMIFLAAAAIDNSRSCRMAMKKKKVRDINIVLIGITIISFVIIVYISGKYTGFRLNYSLSSEIIYDFRQEAKENNLPTILRYILMWIQVIMPVLIAYFISKKNHLMVAICIITVLLMFGYNGAKTPFLMAILAVLFNVMKGIKLQKINRWVIVWVTIFCFVSVLEYIFHGTYVLEGMFIRRVLFLPNLVSSYYFDFFSYNMPDFFRSGALSFLFDGGPYQNLQSTIGLKFTGTEQWMNGGMIADAVMNLGLAGVFIFPWLIIITLHILDRCSEGIDIRIYITTSILIAFTLINSFLSVTLVSHGSIVLMILLQAMKSSNVLTNNKK